MDRATTCGGLCVVMALCVLTACASDSEGAGANAGAGGSGGSPAVTGGAAGHAVDGGSGQGGGGSSSGSGGTGTGPAGTGAAGGSGDGGSPQLDAGSDGGADGAIDAAVRSGVTIEDGRLWVDGEEFLIRGVDWNPVPKGGVHPADLDFEGFVAQDAALMRAAGINAVRTYEPITDIAVLDALHAAGIYVLNATYAWGGDEPSVVDARVSAVKDHPAILLWVLGNEWNYNGLYVGMSHADSLAALNEAAARIRAIDDEHPIATVYGEIPSRETIEAMPLIDIWGINAYRGLGFGNLFDQLAANTDKPMFLAEYGADAYDANQDAVNLQAQADATRALTQEIIDHGAATGSAGQCLGGTIFEWADEWWKDGDGSASMQEPGGIAPGGGPHPDQTFNEEWWGVVDIDRNPRPAYEALKALYTAP
jgi:hypothetical protein